MEHAPMPPAAGRVYQLTEDTVSPTRHSGRGDDGLPREETVPAIKHEKFVDPAGNICDVILRNGRVLSNDAVSERYEAIQRKDQIMAGSLPLSECPLTSEYRKLTGTETLLGSLPDGAKACDGAPDGCEHLKPVIAARLAKTRMKWELENKKASELTTEQAEAMVRAAVSGFAAPAAAGDARKGMKDGK